MSLEQLASAYDSHTSSEGSNSSNSAQSSLSPTSISACTPAKKGRLEVPQVISAMFPTRKWIDEPQKHGGRQRAFEHEQGTWPSHFFVQTCDKEYIEDVQKLAVSIVPFLKRIDCEQSHISVSKTLKCRYHWIKPLYSLVRQGLQTRKPFLVSFSRFSLYENDEKNAVFLAMDVDLGANELVDVCSRVDVALENFRLPRYYSQPKFHISVGWAPVDQKNELLSCLPDLQKELDDYCMAVELAGVVDRVSMKSGCKFFELPLGFEIPNMSYKTAGDSDALSAPRK